MLLGMSPRSLSVCFINELGSVMPTFSVLSLYVVLTILILYKIIDCYKSIGSIVKLLVLKKLTI